MLLPRSSMLAAWMRLLAFALLALTLALRCWNADDVLVQGRVFFVDPDCYSRMTRVRQIVEHPGTVVRHHEFENWPEGIRSHATAPMDYLIAGLAGALRAVTADLPTALDLAGAWISPLLGLITAAFLWLWAGAMGGFLGIGTRHRLLMLLLFAVSPILVHGTLLGRPDHQSLQLLCVAVALGAEAVLLVRAGGAAPSAMSSATRHSSETVEATAVPSPALPSPRPSCFWPVLGGLAWGLGLWVSLYEPFILWLFALGFGVLALRRRFFSWQRAAWAAALGAVVTVAALVDGWQLPEVDPVVSAYFANWSRTIGELAHVRPWELAVWVGWLALPASLLLLWAGLRRRAAMVTAADQPEQPEQPEPLALPQGQQAAPPLPRRLAWFWLIVLLLLGGLTCWQMRWGYFFALAFVMALPVVLETLAALAFSRRWVAVALFWLSLWPVAGAWDRELFDEEGLDRRAEQRADNLALYDVAQSLRGPVRLPVLAPWWLSPALAYWSGQPCVAGSSHQSLPGIVASSRFFVERDPEKARAILRKRRVAAIVAYDSERVLEVSGKILNVEAKRFLGPPTFIEGGTGDQLYPMAQTLYERKLTPGFLEEAHANPAFRVFLFPEGIEQPESPAAAKPMAEPPAPL